MLSVHCNNLGIKIEMLTCRHPLCIRVTLYLLMTYDQYIYGYAVQSGLLQIRGKGAVTFM